MAPGASLGWTFSWMCADSTSYCRGSTEGERERGFQKKGVQKREKERERETYGVQKKEQEGERRRGRGREGERM